MPEPRAGRLPVAGAQFTMQPERRDPALVTRRRRAGQQRLGRDHRGALAVEIRNGLPDFKPYVYRGTGYDQMESSNA